MAEGSVVYLAQVMCCFDLHLPSFSLLKRPEEKDPKKKTCSSIEISPIFSFYTTSALKSIQKRKIKYVLENPKKNQSETFFNSSYFYFGRNK